VAAANGQPAGEIEGSGEEMLYYHDARNLDLYLFYKRFDADLRADLGFITQTGYRHIETGGGYAWLNDSDHWWNRLGLDLGYEHNEQLDDGPRLHGMFNSWLSYAGLMQSYVTARFSLGEQHYDGREFDIRFLRLDSGISPSGRITLGLAATVGAAVDYEHTRAADRVRLQPSANLRLGRHFEAELAHIHEQLDVDAGRLYTADVTEVRLVYQLDRRAFVRAILQRASYDRNTALYAAAVPADETSLLGQFLFSYKINPRTVLFLGYAGNYHGDGQADLAQTDRTVFAKVSYAWTL